MINVGQATVADVKMAVGTSSQTVEVTSAAPLVQADNADLSTNFDQNVVANAPNGGNDLTYIAQTAPGINMNTGMGYGNFNTAGLPATSNVFTMNGENQMDPYLNLNNSGATNLMLGKNAVQEATVITNAYGGQYGQQAGAQVSYVTKSGTNAYHGNADYWWTGSALDANSWFAGQADLYRRRPSTTTTHGPLRLAVQSRRTSCSSSPTGKEFATSFLPRRLISCPRTAFRDSKRWPTSRRPIRLRWRSTRRCSACIRERPGTPTEWQQPRRTGGCQESAGTTAPHGGDFGAQRCPASTPSWPLPPSRPRNGC